MDLIKLSIFHFIAAKALKTRIFFFFNVSFSHKMI